MCVLLNSGRRAISKCNCIVLYFCNIVVMLAYLLTYGRSIESRGWETCASCFLARCGNIVIPNREIWKLEVILLLIAVTQLLSMDKNDDLDGRLFAKTRDLTKNNFGRVLNFGGLPFNLVVPSIHL